MIRVLIVDDSVVVRRIIKKILTGDPGIEICGTASNGAQALEKVTALEPDIITLDIEMPVMDGLVTVAELRRRGFDMPVIMLSGLTGPGAAATLEALSLGATDFVRKPSQTARISDALDAIGPELIAKVKGLFARDRKTTPTVCKGAPPSPLASGARPSIPEIVVIASSTGGPNALAEIIPILPVGFPVPIVIVQHMPPLFTERLAQTLNDKSSLEVREAYDGAKVETGVVWIARGGHHLEVSGRGEKARLVLHQGPSVNSCRPAADVLFRSVAAEYGSRTLAVVLTGMGEDGCVGAGAIRNAGGQVLIQDEAGSVVWGMAGAVAEAGLANEELPLDQISSRIIQMTSRSNRSAPAPPTKGSTR